MASVVYGADVDELNKLADVFDAEAKTLGDAVGVVSQGVQAAVWLGPVALRFKATWDGQYKLNLSVARETLSQEASRLRLEARQQQSASQGDGVLGSVTGFLDSMILEAEEIAADAAKKMMEVAEVAAEKEAAIEWALSVAANPADGYDQTNRWGPNYDCSSFVLSALIAAGIGVGSATYTGNMREQLLQHGFELVTVDLSTGKGCEPGDILLNDGDHTAMVSAVNGDKITVVQASINEKGTATGGQSGDQTGKEIATMPYYNFPWTCVLRYVGTADS